MTRFPSHETNPLPEPSGDHAQREAEDAPMNWKSTKINAMKPKLFKLLVIAALILLAVAIVLNLWPEREIADWLGRL